MDIKPEVTRITGFTDPGPRGLSNPILSTRNPMSADLQPAELPYVSW